MAPKDWTVENGPIQMDLRARRDCMPGTATSLILQVHSGKSQEENYYQVIGPKKVNEYLSEDLLELPSVDLVFEAVIGWMNAE